MITCNRTMNKDIATYSMMKGIISIIGELSNRVKFMSMDQDRMDYSLRSIDSVDVNTVNAKGVSDALSKILEFVNRAEAFEASSEKDEAVYTELIDDIILQCRPETEKIAPSYYQGNVNCRDVLDVEALNNLTSKFMLISQYVRDLNQPLHSLINTMTLRVMRPMIIVAYKALEALGGELPDYGVLNATGLFSIINKDADPDAESDRRYFDSDQNNQMFKLHKEQQSFTKEEIEEMEAEAAARAEAEEEAKRNKILEQRDIENREILKAIDETVKETTPDGAWMLALNYEVVNSKPGMATSLANFIGPDLPVVELTQILKDIAKNYDAESNLIYPLTYNFTVSEEAIAEGLVREIIDTVQILSASKIEFAANDKTVTRVYGMQASCVDTETRLAIQPTDKVQAGEYSLALFFTCEFV